MSNQTTDSLISTHHTPAAGQGVWGVVFCVLASIALFSACGDAGDPSRAQSTQPETVDQKIKISDDADETTVATAGAESSVETAGTEVEAAATDPVSVDASETNQAVAAAPAEPIPLLPIGPANADAIPGERLLALAPAGWDELFSSHRKGFRLVEYVPAGSPLEWTEKLSFEAVAGDKPDLIGFAESIATDQSAVCEKFETHNTFTGFENQYETVVRLYACTNNPGLARGQVTMLKAIVGEDYFYTVTWAKRVRPFDSEEALPVSEKEIADWSSYLRRIKVCNDRSDVHPCPDTAAVADL